MVSASVNSTSRTDALMVVCAIGDRFHLDRGRDGRQRVRQQHFDALSSASMTLAPGCL